MWIFTKGGFLSIIASDDPNLFIVRARVRADLKKAFPTCRIEVLPDRDYGYRATINRSHVKRFMCSTLDALDYTNFKDAAAGRLFSPRYRAYHAVWAAMRTLQEACMWPVRKASR